MGYVIEHSLSLSLSLTLTTVYSYRLGSRTTAVLFDPKPQAEGSRSVRGSNKTALVGEVR